MASLAIYANGQHWRRNQIETVTVTPATSPSSATPRVSRDQRFIFVAGANN
jgi:hypothetical protein